MGAYDAIKDAITLVQKADNVDLYRSLLDAQKELLDMQSEISRLNLEVRRLNSIIENDKNMQYDEKEQVYFHHCENKKNGPFCPVCWESDKKSIHLQPDTGIYKWYCRVCKNVSGERKPFHHENSNGGSYRII